MCLHICPQCILEVHWPERKKEGRKVQVFLCNSKADKISLVYHTHETKRQKEQNEKKNRLAIKSKTSVRSVLKSQEDYGGKIYGKGI